MASNNPGIKILIGAKDEASSVISGVGNALKKLGSMAVDVFKGISNTVLDMSGLKSLTDAFGGGFGNLFTDSVKAAQRLEEQMGMLEKVIQATGGAAGLTAEDIDAMARRLDEATLGSAERFRTAAGALLTFKSVGKDSFETVLKLAQDMEATNFGTVESNVVQLGKALEDPISGFNALRRSGITFSDDQREVIKSLVETGQQAKAQGIILAAVAGQVKDSAAGAGQGLSGALDLIGKKFTDLKEQLGSTMLPILTKIGTDIANVIGEMANSGAAAKFGETVAKAVQRAYQSIRNTLMKIDWNAFAHTASRAFETISQYISNFIAWVVQVGQSPAFHAIATAISDAFGVAATAVRNFLAEADWTAFSAQVSNAFATAGTVIKNFGTSITVAKGILATLAAPFQAIIWGTTVLAAGVLSLIGGFARLAAGINGAVSAYATWNSLTSLTGRDYWRQLADRQEQIGKKWAEDADKYFGMAEDAMASATKQAGRLGNTWDDFTAGIAATAMVGEQAAAGIQATAASAESAADRVARLQGEYDALAASYKALASAGDTAGADKLLPQLNALYQQLEIAKREVDATAASIEDMGATAQQPIQAEVKVESNADEVQAQVEVIGGTELRTQHTVETNAPEIATTVQSLDGSSTRGEHHIRTNADEVQAQVSRIVGTSTSVHTVKADTRAAESAIAALQRNTSSTHTVYVRKVEQNATGGLVGQGTPVLRRASGGSIFKPLTGTTVPGSGDRDTVPRALPAGSFVIRKAASRAYAPLIDTLLTPGERVIPPRLVANREPFWAALNAMALPRFATGGVVGASASTSAPGTRDSVDINLTLGGQRVQLQGARAQAQALASALREISRA